MQHQTATLIDKDGNGLPDALEEAWGKVLELVKLFMKNHTTFGYELVAKKCNPSLEDLLLSLRVMGSILNTLDQAQVFDGSEQRMLLNAKQQIVWFERATVALKNKDEAEYQRVVGLMQTQAEF